QPLAGFGERHHRGGGPRPLGILDDLGILAVHHGDAGIGGAEVDADDFAHVSVPSAGLLAGLVEPSAARAPIWIDCATASPPLPPEAPSPAKRARRHGSRKPHGSTGYIGMPLFRASMTAR